MRLAYIVRSTLFTIKGGDSIQVINTAAELRKLGVEVDIKLSKDTINYDKYDLLHYFNIIRPADHIYHIKASRKPYVISSIYLDYSNFDLHDRGKLQGLIFKLSGKYGAEYMKNIYRYARRQDILKSKAYLMGHFRSMKMVLKGAEVVLPNSATERSNLHRDFGQLKGVQIIPNGVDQTMFSEIPDVKRKENSVLCVAQVYGMKNQLRLIRACKRIDARLTIIGKPPPNHSGYYNKCLEEAEGKVSFVDFMEQQELKRYYASSAVHALPSWFETTGLSSLEAGAMGCRLVVSDQGETRDYFGEQAAYCRAGDTNSIVEALETALKQGQNDRLRSLILEKYTWKRAAEETIKAYYIALGR